MAIKLFKVELEIMIEESVITKSLINIIEDGFEFEEGEHLVSYKYEEVA